MKRWWSLWIIALMVMLSGCAGSMVRSEVTVFHEWPGAIGEKTYVFERSREQDNNLEYRSYEKLVRAQLQQLGFTEAPSSQAARLKVALSYGVRGRDVRVIEAGIADPFWYGAPLYGHRWRGRGYYGPYYDPFWPVAPSAEFVDNTYQVYSRQLKVSIAQSAGGKKLFDVTVNSEGTTASLAAVMPYLVQSAFLDFPGTSGMPRQVTLRMQD